MMPTTQRHFRTTEQSQFLDAFHRDGFGVVRGALDATDVERMRAMLAEMAADTPRPTTDPLEVHLPRLVERYPGFAALAVAPALLTTLTELFGTTPHLVSSYGHVKPARTRAHTRVHSDIAHLRGVPHGDSMLMVKVMYALTPTDPGSGATLLYPGTHKLSMPGDGRRDHGNGVHLHLAPGDLQIFHANIQHTATPNISSSARLSLWFVYAQPWMRAFPGHEHDEAFLKMLPPQMGSNPALASILGLTNPYSTR